VNLQLLSRPCILWKYFSAHLGILVLKCFQFHFEYSLAVLATLSFSIPHINNRDSHWEFWEPQSEGISCLSNNSSTADIDKFAVWSVALYCMKCPYIFSSFVNNLHNILIFIQQNSTLHSLFYLETALHVSGGTTTHHWERKQLYLHHLVLVITLPR
jgi:hypothetical protein